MTTKLTPTQQLWGQFYRTLNDEASKIRLVMLRAKMAASIAAADADEQPAPQANQRQG
jgi:hypothetical protein